MCFLPALAGAATLNIFIDTTTYIASTDPYNAATDNSTNNYSGGVHTLSATSSLYAGSAFAEGTASQGTAHAQITATKPTLVISQNADSQARTTILITDYATVTDPLLSAGAAVSANFFIAINGSISPRPPCCYDFLYAHATYTVTDLSEGGQPQVAALDYHLENSTGSLSATATVHVGDQLELSYGIDMANYASDLENSVDTLYADYWHTLHYYAGSSNPDVSVIGDGGFSYAQPLAAAPEPSMMALAMGGLALLAVKRRASK